MSFKIDVVRFCDPDAPAKFTASLHRCGFVLVEDAPIDLDLIELAYQQWYDFFLSDDKHNYAWDNDTEDGYVSPSQSEVAKGNDIRDLKEFYHVLAHGRCPDALKATSLKLFEEMTACGKLFLGWIEQSLPYVIRSGLSEPLQQMAEGSTNTVLRTIHYPPLQGDETEGAIRAAAHEDINLLTVLPSATAKGLEVMDKMGHWHQIKPNPRHTIINTGDMLQACTLGYIKSTSHRVINPHGEENTARLSMPLFLHPRNEVVLNERYTALSYRKERITENGLQEKTEA